MLNLLVDLKSMSVEREGGRKGERKRKGGREEGQES